MNRRIYVEDLEGAMLALEHQAEFSTRLPFPRAGSFGRSYNAVINAMREHARGCDCMDCAETSERIHPELT